MTSPDKTPAPDPRLLDPNRPVAEPDRTTGADLLDKATDGTGDALPKPSEDLAGPRTA